MHTWSQRFGKLLGAAALALSALAFTAPAQAKQCVFNKGGYVLHVHWFRVQDLVVDRDPRSSDKVSRVHARSAPVQTAALTAGFGDCTKTDEPLLAVISVPGMVGYNPFNEKMAYNLMGRIPLPIFPVGTRLANAYGVPSNARNQPLPEIGIQCLSGWPGHCPGSGMTAEHRPPGDHVLLITQPSPLRYLDFVGTAFDVSWREGGPIQ
jgi:hypothetical protein